MNFTLAKPAQETEKKEDKSQLRESFAANRSIQQQREHSQSCANSIAWLKPFSPPGRAKQQG
jgi:hypothetical protein